MAIVKTLVTQEAESARLHHQNVKDLTNVAHREESAVIKLSQELASDQFAYRLHTQEVERKADVDYLAMLKLQESQIEQIKVSHQQDLQRQFQRIHQLPLEYAALEDRCSKAQLRVG